MDFVLVTGGAGFIGSHLVKELTASGVRVRVLDDFSSPGSTRLSDKVCNDVVVGSITDVDVCRRAAKGVDTIFHLAALVSVTESVDDPVRADAINSGGTLNVLIAARDAGVRRVVHSSSAAVYGDTQVVPVHEGVPGNPTSPYGVQKLAGELYASCFSSMYDLEAISLRYFNVYGAGQNPTAPYAAVVPKFLTALAEGRRPIVYGDGEQTRDFCSVKDVVRANLLAATTTRAGAVGEAYNIAGGHAISLNQLLKIIANLTGVPIDPIYQAPRVGDIRHSSANIAKARDFLGYEPTVTMVDGIQQALEYYTTGAVTAR